MNFLLRTILTYLLLYKYPVLFMVTFAAALVLPIPSAAPVMASAAFASQGFFKLKWVVVAAGLGNILGDNTGYWLARLFGRPLLYKIGLRRVIDSSTFRTVEGKLERHRFSVIFFSRFEVISTVSVNIMAGLGRMSYGWYLLYELVGELTQVAIYVSLGYFFGSQWPAISAAIGDTGLIIAALLILVLVLFRKKLIKK